MTSTSDSDWLVRARGLRLHFDVRLRPPTSFRELFARWIWTAQQDRTERRRIDAICDVTFDVRRGDRIGLIGQNGSGKTSLCRCVGGIYQPRSGLLARRGEIRSLFCGFPLIENELTGRENARLLASLLYTNIADRAQLAHLVEESLAFSELGPGLLDMPLKYYSTGMRARLVLSLMSAAPCDLLILDEVFDGADQFFRERVAARMRDVMRRSGAVLFVSHSMQLVRENCNRVWVYDAGRILFDGPIEQGIDLYTRRFAPPAPAQAAE
jgi:ABC-type polysaccharide/polyol phosphate transport system ATPase subunit